MKTESVCVGRWGQLADWKLLRVTLVLVCASCPLYAQEVPVIVETGTALTVACTRDLDFGTIGVAASSSGGSINVPATESGTARIASGSSFTLTGGSQSAACDITAPENSTVSIAISGGGGTFQSSGELTGASLEGPGSATLQVDLQLSHTSGETSSTETSAPVHVGGTLFIPSGFDAYGTYTRTFTITVTE